MLQKWHAIERFWCRVGVLQLLKLNFGGRTVLWEPAASLAWRKA